MRRACGITGSASAAVEGLSDVFRQIAYREGIGDLLADGTRRLSEKFGGKEFAIHSKGLELSAYEPRYSVGMGLGYATSNRGRMPSQRGIPCPPGRLSGSTSTRLRRTQRRR